MKEHRLLITGSRDWTDENAVRDALTAYWQSVQPATITLVSGHCGRGADAIAEKVWQEAGLPVETHPAHWSRGPKAGPERNAHMVALGADHCIAFIGPCTSRRCTNPEPHDSHGATSCADLAITAGIPTSIVRSSPTTSADAATIHRNGPPPR